MADRFPSLEDIDGGKLSFSLLGRLTCTDFRTGATEVRDVGADDGDFLARERAALGEDAEMFGAGTQRQTTVEDGDDDLLGGDFAPSSKPNDTQYDDFDTFESSFPAVDNTNDVSYDLRTFTCYVLTSTLTEHWTWWHNHWLDCPLSSPDHILHIRICCP